MVRASVRKCPPISRKMRNTALLLRGYTTLFFRACALRKKAATVKNLLL